MIVAHPIAQRLQSVRIRQCRSSLPRRRSVSLGNGMDKMTSPNVNARAKTVLHNESRDCFERLDQGCEIYPCWVVFVTALRPSLEIACNLKLPPSSKSPVI